METAPAQTSPPVTGKLLLRSPDLREARIAELEALYAAAKAEAESLYPGEQARGMERVAYVEADKSARKILRCLQWLRALRRGKGVYVLRKGLLDSLSLFVMFLGFSFVGGGKFPPLASIQFWHDNLFLVLLMVVTIPFWGIFCWRTEEGAYASFEAARQKAGGYQAPLDSGP